MRSILILLPFLCLLFGCEGTIELGDNSEDFDFASNPGSGDTQLGSPAATLDGAVLFQTHCGACHGMDATGAPAYPNSILGYVPISPVVSQGSGTMPPIPLSSSEVAAIQSYLTNPGSTPAPSNPVDSPADSLGSTPGIALYGQHCAGCHGADGVGAAGGPPLRLRDPGLVRFTVRQGRNGAGNPTVMPTYDRTTITDAQLDEMIEWLDAFPNPATGEGLYARYCANCHGADGTGGTSFEAVAGTLRAYTIIREGHGGDRYDERAEYMPGWSEEQISDDEIVLIEQYLRTM